VKTRGASGPLTLRCPDCGARNVGASKPIDVIGAPRYEKRGHRKVLVVMVQCKAVAWPRDLLVSGRSIIIRPETGSLCSHTWWTNHSSVVKSADEVNS
jgi:hypothetical protein